MLSAQLVIFFELVNVKYHACELLRLNKSALQVHTVIMSEKVINMSQYRICALYITCLLMVFWALAKLACYQCPETEGSPVAPHPTSLL